MLKCIRLTGGRAGGGTKESEYVTIENEEAGETGGTEMDLVDELGFTIGCPEAALQGLAE